MPAEDLAFAALADPIRRRIVELLVVGERTAGEIADEFAGSGFPDFDFATAGRFAAAGGEQFTVIAESERSDAIGMCN